MTAVVIALVVLVGFFAEAFVQWVKGAFGHAGLLVLAGSAIAALTVMVGGGLA